MKRTLKFLRDGLFIDAFEHGLRAHLQQFGDAVQ
jgi:hypothetical protein